VSAVGVLRLAVLSGTACLAGSVLAAGGHHMVDDAALAAPGVCEVETWAERAAGHARQLVHAGAACRVGAVELGVGVDRSRERAAVPGRATAAGLQLKWAMPITPEWSAGAVLSAGWQRPGPSCAGSALLLPLTWTASPEWMLHLNLGRDFRARAPDATRRGIAAEWTPLPAWSLLAERLDGGDVAQRRFGLRWLASGSWSIDLSHLRTLGAGHAGTAWTLGVNRSFER
jgi:hypothetical protein